MELISLGKFMASLVFVLSLMGGLALLLQYLDKKGGMVWLRKGRGQNRKRLFLVERITLDRHKSAAILRMDDHEYLVISGPSGETVIDRGPATVANRTYPVEKDLAALKGGGQAP